MFSNEAGVPYDWLVMPITSHDSVGAENLVEVAHVKLASTSYAKINNMKCISWSDKIELASKKFKKQYIKDILAKLKKILSNEKDAE